MVITYIVKVYIEVVQYLIVGILIGVLNNATSYQHSRCFRSIFTRMIPH
jgi:hypothetical protein